MKKDEEIKNFEAFLMKSGAMVLPATSEWEVVRFRCDKGTGIVYTRKGGAWTFCGPAREAWDAFKSGNGWSCIDKKRRTKRIIVMDALIARDGNLCFFCGGQFDDSNPNLSVTLEHLLAISNGGSNHIANLVLAHQGCNVRAADMSLVDKIKLRENLLREIEK